MATRTDRLRFILRQALLASLPLLPRVSAVPIRYLDWIERDTLKGDPGARFVFGDNAERRGLGGQAASMRGEPNAIGIATKRRPSNGEGSFFSDDEPADLELLKQDLARVQQALSEGRTVFCPKAGLGTGLSRLPTEAPAIYAYLHAWFAAHSEGGNVPW